MWFYLDLPRLIFLSVLSSWSCLSLLIILGMWRVYEKREKNYQEIIRILSSALPKKDTK